MILIDRSIPKSVATALNATRGDVEWLEPRFPPDTPDTEWLREAGTGGWVVLSRDKKLRTRPAERRAIAAYGVGCFILTQRAPLTPWDYVKVLVPILDELVDRFEQTPRPFIYTVSREGVLRRADSA
jgi:PIN like domain